MTQFLLFILIQNYPDFRVEASDAGVYVCRNSKGRVQNVKLVIESKFIVSLATFITVESQY